MQDPATMLAVNRVGFVDKESTVWALKPDLVGPENRLEQPQEEPDADDHDDDREDPASGTLEGDVAEACRRQRGDGEIKGIHVVRDLRINAVLRDVHGG